MSQETTTINLQNDVIVNGKTFPAGQRVEVPKSQAEDIERIDFDHTKYQKGLSKKHTYEVNSGTFGVGSGAQ